jgi:hypothetical protein
MAAWFARSARARGHLFIAGKGVEACGTSIHVCSISKERFELVSVRIRLGKIFPS